MVNWVKSMSLLAGGERPESFGDFSQEKFQVLASVMAQVNSGGGSFAFRPAFHKRQSRLIQPGNSQAGGRLKKNARLFQNPTCQKLQPGQLDPKLEKAKQKMVLKSSKEWGVSLKTDNPLHYLAAIFYQFHSPKTLRKAYEQVQSIKQEIKKSVSPKASPLQKMKALYKIIETRYPYALMDDLFKGINVGKLDCDTVAMMALFVAYELGWNLKMVYAPHHAFIRWDDCKGPTVNMDLKGVGSQPDRDYARSIPRPAIQSGAYLRSLSERELIGHFLLLKADILKDIQKDRAALKFYNLAYQYSPKNHYVLIHRAHLLYSLGKLQAGHRDLISARRLVPDHSTYLTQAVENYRYKKYAEAEKILIQSFPFPSLVKEIAGIKDPKGRVDLLMGKIGEKLLALGTKYLSQNNPGLAKRQFRMADTLLQNLPKKKQPRYFGSLLKLKAYQGMLYLDSGDFIQAQVSFERLKELGEEIKADPKRLGKYQKIYQMQLKKTRAMRRTFDSKSSILSQ